MAYVEPTSITHFDRPRPPVEAWRIREWLRRKHFSVLAEMRGDLEKHATSLRGNPRDLGDALAALTRVLERALAN
jgi:hypothetical protein